MLNLIPGVGATSAALNAERTRLDIIAQNIANANTTRGLDGRPYQRQQVVFETVLDNIRSGGAPDLRVGGPRVSEIQKDMRPGRSVYQPGHPEANKDGMVQMPNVSVHEEMADLVAASRSFDANLAVLKTARQMTLQSLSLGKR
jgi:flagellar basal-body rod protein FlgC